MQEKKSFLLYFDAYPLLALLPPEQRGWLLSAVYTYAIRAAQEPEVDAQEVLGQFPQLTADARMACGFICNTIGRDTKVWRRHKEARVQRRSQEMEAKQSKDASGWMRDLVQQRKTANRDQADGGSQYT